MHEPRYTSRAQRVMLEMTRYISRDHPVAAAHLLNRIEAECVRLAREPERGQEHPDLPPELLVSVVGSYLVVYRVDEAETLILRVVHGARDLSALFSEN